MARRSSGAEREPETGEAYLRGLCLAIAWWRWANQTVSAIDQVRRTETVAGIPEPLEHRQGQVVGREAVVKRHARPRPAGTAGVGGERLLEVDDVKVACEVLHLLLEAGVGRKHQSGTGSAGADHAVIHEDRHVPAQQPEVQQPEHPAACSTLPAK